MNKYRITLKNNGVREAKGATPIDAFNSIFPDLTLTPLRFNCVSANVCIELINGSRHTTNYYEAKKKPLKGSQHYTEILQFMMPYLEKNSSVVSFNKGIWNETHPVSVAGMQLIKQHGGVIGVVELDWSDSDDDRGEFTYVLQDLSYGRAAGDFTLIIDGSINSLKEADRFLYNKCSKYKRIIKAQFNLQRFGTVANFVEIAKYAQSKLHLEPTQAYPHKIECYISQKDYVITVIHQYQDRAGRSEQEYIEIHSKEQVDECYKKYILVAQNKFNNLINRFRK